MIGEGGKNIHDQNAANSLDEIRTGAANLLLTAHQRLTEVKRALEMGQFGSAHSAASSLQEKLSHLAEAQQTMGKLTSARIMRVGELEPGMRIAEGGEVASVGPCPGCGREECNNMALTLGNGAMLLLDKTDEIVISQD